MYPDEQPSRAARVLMVVAKLMVIAMFLLPIAAITQHAFAVHDAQEAFDKQQAEYQKAMNKMIKDYNDGRPARVRTSTVANP